MRVGWVTGTASLADPGVAAALADAAAGEVASLHLGAAPALTPVAVGVSGSVRVVVGDAPDDVLVAANVDDLDPRVWPGVLAALLAAGAADAWLTPILMKKGRPAHTVTALVAAERAEAVRLVLVAETSTIGVRIQPVGKAALARHERTVDVDGHAVRVKVAVGADGAVTNVMPEWDDVAAAAAALGLPARRVLLRAHVEAEQLWDGGSP